MDFSVHRIDPLEHHAAALTVEAGEAAPYMKQPNTSTSTELIGPPPQGMDKLNGKWIDYYMAANLFNQPRMLELGGKLNLPEARL